MQSTDQSSSGTKLRPFAFWFSYIPNKGKLSKEDYESGIKILGSFSTIEEFWSYYQHMVRPEKLPGGCKFALFQDGIKPAWEDKANDDGGSFILRIKRQYSNIIWEDLMLSYIGEQCQYNDDICGLYLNSKPTEANISIWTRKIDQTKKESIEKWIRETLGFDDKIEVEYKLHPKHVEEPQQNKGISKGFDRGGGFGRRQEPDVKS